MSSDDNNGFVYLIIYSVFIIQLIFFLISNVYYTYNNPHYRVLWAAFCIRQPTNFKPHNVPLTTAPYPDTSNTTSTNDGKSPSRPPILQPNSSQKAVVAESAHSNPIGTKHTAFIHYGLDTISHCILMPLYLICLLFAVCIRLPMCYITHASLWMENQSFCPYVYKLLDVGYQAHYILQIILCIPSLKAQYIYNTNKWQRILPIVSIIFMILSLLITLIRDIALTTYDVRQYKGTATCIATGGIALNPLYMAYITFQYYFGNILCFFTVIVPLYVQKKMLIDLPKNRENEELLALIRKINTLSKRVCVSAIVFISATALVVVLYYTIALHRKIHPFLSVMTWSLWVEGYVLVVFVYPDWKTRLCVLCICARKHTDRGSNQVSIELMSSKGESSSIGVPHLLRDVSKVDLKDDSFPV
eukprot:712924_1